MQAPRLAQTKSQQCTSDYTPPLWGARRRRAAGCPAATPPHASPSNPASQAAPALSARLLLEQSVAMFSAGAVLGPFCDSLHSASDVLHYASPSIWQLGPLQLETCW